MFGFSHVFWLRATSPCFIRDLDAGTIARSIADADGEVSLVVFDDVPCLEPDRIGMLHEQIERLLDRGCEVIVMGAPSALPCSEAFASRFVLFAGDLLLSDRELATARGVYSSSALAPGAMGVQGSRIHAAGPAAANSAANVAMRIPALAWSGAPDQLDSFLVELFKEDFDANRAASILLMMVVGSGAMDMALGDSENAAIEAAELAQHYPHLGIDERAERFDCTVFPIDAVVAAAKIRIRRTALALFGSGHDGLAEHWANLAYGQGLFERSCDIARLLMAERARGAWAVDHAYGLVRAGAFLPAYRLIASLERPAAEDRDQLAVLELACRLHLQDGVTATLCARRPAFTATVAPGIRLLCLTALARHARSGLAERALTEIRDILDNADEGELANPPYAEPLARGVLALGEGAAHLGEFLEYECDPSLGRDGDALCILSAWLLDALAHTASFARNVPSGVDGGTGEAGRVPAAPEAVVSFVCNRLEGSHPLACDSFAVAAGLALEHARMEGVVVARKPLAGSVLLALRQAEASVLGQRMRFELDSAHERDLQVDRMETHPDILYTVAPQDGIPAIAKRAPVLSVRLFGRLGLTIGDVPVDDRLIGRRKVRKLIVMLAMNCGHEIGRDAICGQLWPASTLDVARRNFYNVLSLLKRAITLPDGTCPYLIRRRLSCALDDRTVSTDVMRLDHICREFLFGQPDEEAWGELYTEIDRDFYSEIVPDDTDDYIESVRRAVGGRLVDALATGARRITESGSPECGIWLARAAIGRDRTREDAYIALMDAQDAAHQRPAALLTFQDMRKALGEELAAGNSRRSGNRDTQKIQGKRSCHRMYGFTSRRLRVHLR